MQWTKEKKEQENKQRSTAENYRLSNTNPTQTED